MNENNSKKNRPKSQIMLPNSTSPLPSQSRKNGSSDSLPTHRYENEWEVRSKELAEAKARVAQMEKTMRWWSDCTDNWRKKWSEVKSERNDLRKELRITKSQMEKLAKQLTASGQQELHLAENNDLAYRHRESTQSNGFAGIHSNANAAMAHHSASNKYCTKPIPQYGDKKTNPYPDCLWPRKNAQTQTSVLTISQLSIIDKEIVALLEEKVAHLTSKLDEVNRRLVMERDEKAHLHLTIDRLRRDLSDLHELYDNLKKELCDINGKEFTESEVESYAEEEADEDGRNEDAVGEDAFDHYQFDPENEIETDKHTPTAEAVAEVLDIQHVLDQAEALENILAVESEKLEARSRTGTSGDSEIEKDFKRGNLVSSSSIQVEISAVHKKLDLMTFINDVTELVTGGADGAKAKGEEAKCPGETEEDKPEELEESPVSESFLQQNASNPSETAFAAANSQLKNKERENHESKNQEEEVLGTTANHSSDISSPSISTKHSLQSSQSATTVVQGSPN